jgi:hypothetical protein
MLEEKLYERADRLGTEMGKGCHIFIGGSYVAPRGWCF